MGLLDKFLSALKLNDDYEDEDFLDDEDFDEEPKPKKSFFKKSAKSEDDFEDFDDFDREYDDEPVIRKTLKDSKNVKTAGVKPAKPMISSQPKNSYTSGSSKIAPMRSRKNDNNDMSLCVVKPKSMEDAREITETLISNCTVVLNLEGLDIDLAQRIVDFTSGSIYALNGGLQRVNNTIFIITPQNVDISGDITDLLNGAFDIPSMNFNY